MSKRKQKKLDSIKTVGSSYKDAGWFAVSRDKEHFGS